MIETFFTEKTIVKKLIIAIVFVFMFNFTFGYLGNNIVFADEKGEVMDDSEITDEVGGGKLLLPIHSLLLFLADAVLEIMQRSFAADMPVTITASADSERKFSGAAIAGIVIGSVVAVAACIVTLGAGAAIIGAGVAATGLIATATAVTTAVATYGGVLVGGLIFGGLAVGGIVYSTDKFIDNIQGEFDLPTIMYTPEEIFANRIPLFNINFFNPSESVKANYNNVKFDWGEDRKIDYQDPIEMALFINKLIEYMKTNDITFKEDTSVAEGKLYEMHGLERSTRTY